MRLLGLGVEEGEAGVQLVIQMAVVEEGAVVLSLEEFTMPQICQIP